MEIIKYPDGSSYATVPDIYPEIYYDQEFTFRINTYEDLWHLNQIVDAFNNLGMTPEVTIPWLIDGQADRRFKPNHSSGLKLVCKLLDSMNARFKIFHPHNPEVVEASIDNVEIIDNSEFISNVLNILVENHGYDARSLDTCTTVLLPDGGAYKWGVKLMDKIDFGGDVIAASKNRNFVNGKSVLTQQLPDYDFEGKDILIIDDACIYGGTFKGLAKMLRERNCGKLYLAVSHITVQNFEKDNVFGYFDKVFTTNSKFDDYWVRIDRNSAKQIPNLEVIKLF